MVALVAACGSVGGAAVGSAAAVVSAGSSVALFWLLVWLLTRPS
ncbi:hypothetical protein [Actinomadura geliboluensis]|nr:hypothetical protein [Actinomadura geliboluensis]